jgi:hypothetical protein
MRCCPGSQKCGLGGSVLSSETSWRQPVTQHATAKSGRAAGPIPWTGLAAGSGSGLMPVLIDLIETGRSVSRKLKDLDFAQRSDSLCVLLHVVGLRQNVSEALCLPWFRLMADKNRPGAFATIDARCGAAPLRGRQQNGPMPLRDRDRFGEHKLTSHGGPTLPPHQGRFLRGRRRAPSILNVQAYRGGPALAPART